VFIQPAARSAIIPSTAALAVARGRPSIGRNGSIFERQAYRDLDRAQRLQNSVLVGDVKASFTVKLSRRLVKRLRAYAASTGLTLGHPH